MGHFTASAVIIFAFLTVAACQVQWPCDSSLRNITVLASYFEHCECQYSNWTDLTPLVHAIPISVPSSRCSSGFIIRGERWQYAISGYECYNRTEEDDMCVCRYGNWTYEPIVNATPIEVPRNQCKSGYVVPGVGWKVAIDGPPCEDEREDVYLCEFRA